MPTQISAPPYKIIADCFRDKSLVPFLGSATSFVGTKSSLPLPSGSQFASELLEDQTYPGNRSDELPKISQFIEEVQADRQYLLKRISTRFLDSIPNDYSTSFTQFLGTAPASMIPRLIITTNYDVLVERALEERAIPYIALSCINKNSKYAGRWICYRSVTAPLTSSEIKVFSEVEDLLLEIDESDTPPPVIIYKLHGTAKLKLNDQVLDSIVLTENDYVDFLATDTLQKIPSKLLGRLRTSRLLFLGYSLEDWNLRVLLRRIRMLQQVNQEGTLRHWAFQKQPAEIEAAFWHYRGVSVYDVSLDVCLSELMKFSG